MAFPDLARPERNVGSTGFGYAADARAARRQFRLSVGVVVSLAAGIAAAILNLGVRPAVAPITGKALTVLSMAGPLHPAKRVVTFGS